LAHAADLTPTVVCVLRSGGAYGPEYVERLAAGVRRYSGWPFVALSDQALECRTIPLEHAWPGWWSKIELFRPGLFEGPVLYLDLDTVITGSLAPLMARRHRFTMLADFFKPQFPASGVMAWCGDWSRIYQTFAAAPEAHMARCRTRQCWGDGGFIARQLREPPELWQALAPGLIVSRKVQATRNADERVVCFHGRPRPAEVGWRV
jgi:hypothetical protein